LEKQQRYSISRKLGQFRQYTSFRFSNRNRNSIVFKVSWKGDKIILEEFLFTEESIVKNNKEEGFSNQFILSFFKEQL